MSEQTVKLVVTVVLYCTIEKPCDNEESFNIILLSNSFWKCYYM